MNLFGLTERIDEVWNKIFVFGFFANSFFFVFDDDLVVCNFDNFFARNSELGVGETLEKRAPYDDLLESEIFASDGKV